MRKGLRPLRVYPRFFYLFNTATEFNDTYINDSVICMRTHSEKVMSTSASHLSAPIHSFRNFKKPSSLFKFPSKQSTIIIQYVTSSTYRFLTCAIVQGHHLAFIETAERVKNHKYTHNWRQRS